MLKSCTPALCIQSMKTLKSCTFLIICCTWFTSASLIQAKVKHTDPFQHPFANPVDKPDLPRVMIVGDSISIAYTPIVRKLLDGVANVHRPKTNCRWSAFGDDHIEEWLGDSKWDVIHFNFGLWDWYGWRQETKATPQSYANSLESIIQKIRKNLMQHYFLRSQLPLVWKLREMLILLCLKIVLKNSTKLLLQL